MSEPTIAVDADALRQVLQALIGPPHHARELQATRSLHKLGHANPIETLVEQYQAWCDLPDEARAQPAQVEAVPQCEKYDETLLPFLGLMRQELHANSSKGDRPGWLSMTAETCLLEIYWHVSKLSVAVRDQNPQRIAEHAADVANMAMMQADIAGVLAAAPQQKGGA